MQCGDLTASMIRDHGLGWRHLCRRVGQSQVLNRIIEDNCKSFLILWTALLVWQLVAGAFWHPIGKYKAFCTSARALLQYQHQLSCNLHGLERYLNLPQLPLVWLLMNSLRLLVQQLPFLLTLACSKVHVRTVAQQFALLCDRELQVVHHRELRPGPPARYWYLSGVADLHCSPLHLP